MKKKGWFREQRRKSIVECTKYQKSEIVERQWKCDDVPQSFSNSEDTQDWGEVPQPLRRGTRGWFLLQTISQAGKSKEGNWPGGASKKMEIAQKGGKNREEKYRPQWHAV